MKASLKEKAGWLAAGLFVAALTITQMQGTREATSSCEQRGGTTTTEYTSLGKDGERYSVCHLPDGTTEWFR